MKAVILAGGMGTRLAPLTDGLPKPMVKMVDKPVMECVIEQLRLADISEIAVTLNYLPQRITDYFEDGKKFGVELTYFYEDKPLGTAGSVKQAESFLGGDFVIIAADAYTKISIAKLIDFHFAKKSCFTVAAVRRRDVKGLGVIEMNRLGRISRFTEKPDRVDKRFSFVNTGIYVANKSVFEGIPSGYFYDFGRDVLPKLAGRAYSMVFNEYWSDIGTLKTYYQTNLDIVSGNV